MRLSMLALLALLLLPLAACGDKSTSDGGAEGAATPEELVEKMRALAKNDDFVGAVPLTLPKQRSLITFGLGIMGPSMTIAMGEMMAGMGDPAKAEETKAKLAKQKADFEALLKKYKIDQEPEAAMGQAQDLQKDPEAAMEALNKALGHVDHEAFLKEALALMDSMGDDDKGESKKSSKMPTDFGAITVDGDKATVEVKDDGDTDTMHLVKHEGRWYMDFASIMLNKNK